MGHMTKPSADILKLPLEVRAEMAMKAAFEKVVEEHIRSGRPIHVWRDGRVVAVSPQELQAQSSPIVPE
jgi:hypothetical protein